MGRTTPLDWRRPTPLSSERSEPAAPYVVDAAANRSAQIRCGGRAGPRTARAANPSLALPRAPGNLGTPPLGELQGVNLHIGNGVRHRLVACYHIRVPPPSNGGAR